jgi:tetratricopeptide (TPR) repeat protein
MGYTLTMRGRSEEALKWLERAIELNPFRPAWYDCDLSYALYALERYAEASEVQERVPDTSIFQETRLAAAYAMAGNLPKAAAHMGKAIDSDPSLDILAYFHQITEYEHDADLQHLLEGIKRAFDAYRDSSQSLSSASARSSEE